MPGARGSIFQFSTLIMHSLHCCTSFLIFCTLMIFIFPQNELYVHIRIHQKRRTCGMEEFIAGHILFFSFWISLCFLIFHPVQGFFYVIASSTKHTPEKENQLLSQTLPHHGQTRLEKKFANGVIKNSIRGRRLSPSPSFFLIVNQKRLTNRNFWKFSNFLRKAKFSVQIRSLIAVRCEPW